MTEWCRQLVWSSWRSATKCFQNSPSKADTAFRFIKGGQWKLQHKLQTQLHRAQRWRSISQPCSTQAGANQKQCLMLNVASQVINLFLGPHWGSTELHGCNTLNYDSCSPHLFVLFQNWTILTDMSFFPFLSIRTFMIINYRGNAIDVKWRILRILYMAYITDQFTSLIYQNSNKWLSVQTQSTQTWITANNQIK